MVDQVRANLSLELGQSQSEAQQLNVRFTQEYGKVQSLTNRISRFQSEGQAVLNEGGVEVEHVRALVRENDEVRQAYLGETLTMENLAETATQSEQVFRNNMENAFQYRLNESDLRWRTELSEAGAHLAEGGSEAEAEWGRQF